MKGSERTHHECLEMLVRHLDTVGEPQRNLHWIIKDGLWQREEDCLKYKMPDIIAVYHGRYAVPIELKSVHSKRGKAVEQIQSGYRFITSVLQMDCPYGKFVWYNDMPTRFGYEEILRDELVRGGKKW